MPPLRRHWVCGLRPPECEYRNGADSGGVACVLGKVWVAPRLLSADAVALGAGQFADAREPAKLR
jgi:hypothetical protein